MTRASKSNKISLPERHAFALLCILVIGILGVLLYTNVSDAGKLTFSAKATVYTVQTEQYPRFSAVTIDPLDVKVGDVQRMAVKIEDPSGVVSVNAQIEHDNGADVIELKQTGGAWFGQWNVHDTHNTTYHTIFTATNGLGETNSITLAWTDPCTPPLGGEWLLDGNCIVTGIDGVDNGNLIIQTGTTLTIQNGGTFVWNPTRQIILYGGSIAIADGGQLKKTYLWAMSGDNDGDGHKANLTKSIRAQDMSPGGAYVRRYAVTNDFGDDCDDNCSTCYPSSTNYTKVADGKDQNCDGAIDDATAAVNVRLNSATGLYCTAMCTNNGETCASVGNDVNGADTWTWDYSGSTCHQVQHTCDFALMTADGGFCSGHNSKWTNCRCSYNQYR